MFFMTKGCGVQTLNTHVVFDVVRKGSLNERRNYQFLRNWKLNFLNRLKIFFFSQGKGKLVLACNFKWKCVFSLEPLKGFKVEKFANKAKSRFLLRNFQESEKTFLSELSKSVKVKEWLGNLSRFHLKTSRNSDRKLQWPRSGSWRLPDWLGNWDFILIASQWSSHCN